MTKLFLCFILGGLMIICCSHDVAINNPVALLHQYRAIEQIYQRAEKLSSPAGNVAMQTRAKQLYQEALSGFQQLIPSARQIGYDSLVFCLYLRSGDICYKKENNDSALIFYKKAEQVSNSYNYLLSEKQQYYSQLRTLNIPHGLLFKHNADQLAATGRYYEAIQQYQQAILQFDTSFTSTDIYKNPERFNTEISFTYLFSSLTAKAEAFEHLRPGQKNIKALNSSSGAYRSALLLAEFVKTTYNSEEVRFFLNEIKHILQNRPIKVSTELFELTGHKNYMDEAYLFDQRIKMLNLSADIDTALRQTGIARSIPPIALLQQLIDKGTAILSFHMADNELTIFIITRNEAGYYYGLVPQNFLANIDSFMLSLRSEKQEYNNRLTSELYQTLISPIREKLKRIKRLIIIPDKELNYLPFEALQNKNSKYLVEEFSVQYQYSTALLGRQVTRSGQPADSPNILTSLWKTENEASIFITNQLHEYLDEGYSRDKALQKARIDLLRNNEIDSRFKTPPHWANQILIGEYEAPYTPTPWLLISIIASVIAAVLWIITVKSNY